MAGGPARRQVAAARPRCNPARGAAYATRRPPAAPAPPVTAPAPPMTAPGSYTEEIKVTGSRLVETVRNLVRAGNVRRVVVRNGEGRTVLDIPLTAGLVSAVLLPFYAAIAGLAALAASYTIVVEREGPPAPIGH